MKTAIVDKQTLQVVSMYPGEASQGSYGGPWGNSELFVHVSWDEAQLGEQVKAEMQEDQIVIIEDVQAVRNAKLALMRSIRDAKLKEVDIMCNELATGARSDASAVGLYRLSLLLITEAYKDEQDPSAGSAVLDNLERDLSDLVWPLKP